MERWRGKVAIVTGASAGIGEAIFRALAQNGMKVVGVARRLDLVQKIADELSKSDVYALQCDVSKEKDVARVVQWTVDHLGGIDVLVNNAGTCHMNLLTEIEMAKFREMLDINVIGMCSFSSQVIKQMQQRNEGHVFNVSSICGHQIFDVKGLNPYTISKHAARIMTECFRREMRDAQSRIKITEIVPGATRTRMHPPSMDPSVKTTRPYLNTSDVADAIIHALTVPEHVQVYEIVVCPTGDQRR